MKKKQFLVATRDGLSPDTELILEPFLSALRNRDGGNLAQLAAEAAAAAREARADFVRRGVKRDAPSHALGSLETLESLTERAAQRHGRNAQFETVRRRGASALLLAVGRSSGGVATHKQLTERLPGIQPSNISRLTRELRNVGLLVDSPEAPSAESDARVRPMSLTFAAQTLLDQTHPGWREATFEEADADEDEDAREDAAAEAARLDSMMLESFQRILPQLIERLGTEFTKKIEADKNAVAAREQPAKSQTSVKHSSSTQEISVKSSLVAAANETTRQEGAQLAKPPANFPEGSAGYSRIMQHRPADYRWRKSRFLRAKTESGSPATPQTPALRDRTRQI